MYNRRIQFRSEAVLRIMDTASGKPLEKGGVCIRIRNRECRFLWKPGGWFCLLDARARQFPITILAEGYEEKTIRISDRAARDGPPGLDVPMIPAVRGGKRYFTVAGVLPGIRELTAIRLTGEALWVKGYDPKNRLLTLCRTIREPPGQTGCALMKDGENAYEPVELDCLYADGMLRLCEPAVPSAGAGSVVRRLIYGETEASGRYLLRLCRTSEREDCLLRWMTRDGVFFRRFSFGAGEPEERSL